MQVLTLDTNAFDRHAKQLSLMVTEGGVMKFDAVVAIRRGGSFVCDAFCRHFPKDRYGARYDVKLQRPSTKHKKGTGNKLLKCLPTIILNLMRMAESNLLSLKRIVNGPHPAPKVELPDGLVSILQNANNPYIVINDDAIPSSAPRWALVSAL